MHRLSIAKPVIKELDGYPLKVHKQIVNRILALQFDPRPHDSKKIANGLRVDSGEYRIYYEILEDENLVSVELVGKRGDDEVYRRLARLKR
ncbi:MAG: type II toxin-antitoxin system RelE/ParE family toxin [Chloroflexi bacterium]|nr:type II toxin-antitoxin system RelE/ParE family toxin [Chloroflexota bacterium]